MDIITITSQNGKENNQEYLNSHDNSITPLLDKGKAKNNEP